jgi:mannosyltransferase OCH1-like enzyme
MMSLITYTNNKTNLFLNAAKKDRLRLVAKSNTNSRPRHKVNPSATKNTQYTLKSHYNSIIPLKIYQTWHTKNLPGKMKERVDFLKAHNPEFEHCLFDDNDCREFIKHHYASHVLRAYDNLIPGAYKADLWRLCVLYKNGGIYMDIKLNCINGFKLIELTETEHFVLDRLPPLTIYNALLVCKPGNPFLWRAICRIVANVQYKIYGNSPLAPTGPVLLGNIILRNQLKLNTDLAHHIHGGYVLYKGHFVISTDYPEYNNERKNTYKNTNLKRYNELWNERRIYK